MLKITSFSINNKYFVLISIIDPNELMQIIYYFENLTKYRDFNIY